MFMAYDIMRPTIMTMQFLWGVRGDVKAKAWAIFGTPICALSEEPRSGLHDPWCNLICEMFTSMREKRIYYDIQPMIYYRLNNDVQRYKNMRVCI